MIPTGKSTNESLAARRRPPGLRLRPEMQSHIFNVLDARGAVGVTERAQFLPHDARDDVGLCPRLPGGAGSVGLPLA